MREHEQATGALGRATAPRSAQERMMARFGATLVAMCLRIGLSFFSGVLIARGLGASGYGDLSFLLGSFMAVMQLLEMGTSSAFYTFISQRPQGRSFFVLYGGWLALQFTVIILLAGLALPDEVMKRIWLGHDRGSVVLAFAANFLTGHVWVAVSQLGEARRKTVIVQCGMVLLAGLHLVLIAAAVWWKILTVHVVLWCMTIEYLPLIAILGPILLQHNVAPDDEGYQTIVGRFVTYCKPLILFGVVGFAYTFFDRWFLQRFGGAQQQGFFATSQQFATVSVLITTSVLQIFGKEIAEARQAGRTEQVKHLYQRVAQGCWCISAAVSCLLIPHSRDILVFLLGPGYEGAWLSLTCMLFFPILQSLGQINGMFFYATEQTDIYSRLGILAMVLGIPLTYLLLAPVHGAVPGFGLGALGLSLKAVLLACCSVGMQAYVIARTLRLPRRWVLSLGSVILALLSLSYSSKWLVERALQLLTLHAHPVLLWGCSAIVYGLGVAALILMKPSALGLERVQITELMQLPRTIWTALTGRTESSKRPWADGRMAISTEH